MVLRYWPMKHMKELLSNKTLSGFNYQLGWNRGIIFRPLLTVRMGDFLINKIYFTQGEKND
jgi:hypothetical protein